MNALHQVVPEVVQRLKKTAGTNRHPVVVLVPKGRSAEPMVHALRERGFKAAIGAHAELAPIRVYRQDELPKAVAFLARYSPGVRDAKFIPSSY